MTTFYDERYTTDVVQSIVAIHYSWSVGNICGTINKAINDECSMPSPNPNHPCYSYVIEKSRSCKRGG